MANFVVFSILRENLKILKRTKVINQSFLKEVVMYSELATVLVVDDEPSVSDFLYEGLSEVGYNCTKTTNGEVSLNVVHWIDSIYRNDKLLEEKLCLISHNISKKIITHEFFEGVEDFAFEQVKTEGIIGKIKGLRLMSGYKKLLKDLANALEQNNFEAFMNQRFQKTTIDSDLRLGIKK